MALSFKQMSILKVDFCKEIFNKIDNKVMYDILIWSFYI